MLTTMPSLMGYGILWRHTCPWEVFKVYDFLSLWKLTGYMKLGKFSSVTQLCLTLCDPMDCSMPGFPLQHQPLNLLKLMFFKLVMLCYHLILCVPFSSCPQSFLASGPFPMSWLFSSRGQSIAPSASASVLPVNFSGLISFRIDWFDLLAVQRTLRSLFQHHSSKALILQCSAFFIVQLSHPYMTTGKIIAWTRWTFFGKVLSLLSNMLSKLVIAFPPRSKRLLISRLQSPSAVILEPKNKIAHCFHCFPIYLP